MKRTPNRESGNGARMNLANRTAGTQYSESRERFGAKYLFLINNLFLRRSLFQKEHKIIRCTQGVFDTNIRNTSPLAFTAEPSELDTLDY